MNPIFLRVCFSVVAIWFMGSLAFGDQQMAQPDILLIMPDQMRGDCLSTLGHPVVKTPTMDKLAEQGVLFRRAYSTVPSCIPARYAMLTGLSPQTSGVVGFKKKPITGPTMLQLLGNVGYATALVGREMHQIAAADELGYQTAVLGSTYQSNDNYAAALRQAVPEIDDLRSWVTDQGLTYNLWQAKPWPLTNDLHPTTWVVTQARQLLEESPKNQPLFLTTSFYAPHPPLFPPQEYFESYRKQDLPVPAHGDWVAWDKLTREGSDGGHRVLLDGKTLTDAQSGYFGLIEHLDHEIAPLVQEFQRRSEQAGRPWLVIVTSDHGEMLGDHGYFRKCEPFEGSANIPFLITGSKDMRFCSGHRSVIPVCLEDLLPTLVEFAGADCPAVDGISLAPVLRGDHHTVREWLHFEHATCYSTSQAFHALTDGHVKYIWRPLDGREHLFDLDADPQEVRDLSQDESRHIQLLQWRQRLIQRLAPRAEGFSDGKELVSGRPYPPLNPGLPRTAGPAD